METVLQADAPPLRRDSSGAQRVGDSRVLFELVVHAFEDGATPEPVAQQVPTTTLVDLYGVIAYYLRHRGEVDRYLAERERKAAAIRGRVDSQQLVLCRDCVSRWQRLPGYGTSNDRSRTAPL